MCIPIHTRKRYCFSSWSKAAWVWDVMTERDAKKGGFLILDWALSCTLGHGKIPLLFLYYSHELGLLRKRFRSQLGATQPCTEPTCAKYSSWQSQSNAFPTTSTCVSWRILALQTGVHVWVVSSSYGAFSSLAGVLCSCSDSERHWLPSPAR